MQMTGHVGTAVRGGLGQVSCQHGHGGVSRTRSGPQKLVLPLEPICQADARCFQGCPAKTTQPLLLLPVPEAFKTSTVTPLLIPSLGFCLAAAELSCLGRASFVLGQNKEVEEDAPSSNALKAK